ncbi:hypothetical protein MTO96_024334 [Rhipicephalus appendiculatus]
MAKSAEKTDQGIAVYEGALQMVLPLDNPEAIHDLVFTNCFCSEWSELRTQISRFPGLRSLRCVTCGIEPSQLLLLTLEQLLNLEELEFSLVQEAVVDSEISKVHQIASQKQGVALPYSLRRVYVEVDGDRNFELLGKLLNFYPNLTELHVHLVRGSFYNSLSHCSRFRESLEKLETFAFSSEMPASVPYPNELGASSALLSQASVCGNVRHRKSDDSWSVVELEDLVYGLRGVLTLPSQLAVAALSIAEDPVAQSLFRPAAVRNVWKHVRQICLVLLPPMPSLEFYPDDSPPSAATLFTCSSPSRWKHVVELNLSWFHFRKDLGLIELLPVGSLRRLEALSVPPCGFGSQSAVRRLPKTFPKLRDLDVRFDSRGGTVPVRFVQDSLRHRTFRSRGPRWQFPALSPG